MTPSPIGWPSFIATLRRHMRSLWLFLPRSWFSLARGLVLAGCLWAGLVGAVRAGQAHALLIGVSVYPNLSGKDLEGPVNDLRLMTGLALRMGVEPSRLRVLSEAGGDERWPTRSRILAALGTLTGEVRTGDRVLLYWSGHGAQVPQPAGTRPRRREPDGLDEVLLPRDTRRWDPRRRQVDGAITDDEIGIAVDRLRARGATVWAIFDTCHAGDMLRGGEDDEAALRMPVWRYVSAAELGVPAALSRGGAAPRRRPSRSGATRGAALAFYASQPDEAAPEEWLPDPQEPAVRRRFGVFTHELWRALAQGPTRDFAELAARLERAYAARPFPTPAFEGPLGMPLWSSRSLAGP